MWIVWMIVGALIGFSLFAILSAERDYMNRQRELQLLEQIERMKEDFEQERKGFGLMIRIRDEEIERLKEMLKNED